MVVRHDRHLLARPRRERVRRRGDRERARADGAGRGVVVVACPVKRFGGLLAVRDLAQVVDLGRGAVGILFRYAIEAKVTAAG